MSLTAVSLNVVCLLQLQIVFIGVSKLFFLRIVILLIYISGVAVSVSHIPLCLYENTLSRYD